MSLCSTVLGLDFYTITPPPNATYTVERLKVRKICYFPLPSNEQIVFSHQHTSESTLCFSVCIEIHNKWLNADQQTIGLHRGGKKVYPYFFCVSPACKLLQTGFQGTKPLKATKKTVDLSFHYRKLLLYIGRLKDIMIFFMSEYYI